MKTMPKVRYNDITFDSELEIEYYKHLQDERLFFVYHPKTPIKLNSKNTYTPDFIVFYDDRIEIVETKAIVGIIYGIVTVKCFWIKFAPSISAASYKS